MNANPEIPRRHRPRWTRPRSHPLPNSTQDLRRGFAPRHPRADARDQPVPTRRPPSAPSRIRRSSSTTPPVRTPTRRPRSTSAPACRAARCLDLRARRHRGTATGPTSRYGIERLNDPELAELRFNLHRKPRRAHARQERHPDALCAPGHRHAGDGIRRHPRKPAPQGIPGAAEASGPMGQQHGRPDGPPASGPVVRRQHSGRDHAGIRARRSRPRPRHHPGQHQPPGNRADDHRPQFPGEDQRQHRQLGGDLVDRRGSREDDLGDPLGRRHRDGSVHRQAHPRNPRMDHPQLARCRSAPCRSTRRWKRSTARPRT